MILAALGLILFLFNIAKGESGKIDKGFAKISLWAFGVSFASFISMTVNNTPDSSYLGYFVSIWVWLGAAYLCIHILKSIDGTISVRKVIWFFIYVALLQCTLAIIINKFPIVHNLIQGYITGEKYMGVDVEKGRLFGVGCALDVGGGRLGAILIMISYLIYDCIKYQSSFYKIIFLLFSFFFITVVGNMIGRSATVGAALAIIFLIYFLVTDKKIDRRSISRFSLFSGFSLSLCIISCIFIYNSDNTFRELIRFGFEGFFNFTEKGHFETHSTDLLSQGLIFPDNLHTWLIGDGYFASGMNDPYYIGSEDYGFYKNTDAGYSRFLFYFGLAGLSTIIGFFICVAKTCANRSPKAKYLFYTLLLLNFIIWIKVSTDIFIIFAPFLVLPHHAGVKEKFTDENINKKTSSLPTI